MSPSSTALNGCLVFQLGFCGASALTRSRMKASWTYIGCSIHSVPSLSKVAMRWSSGTKSGPLVTRATKSVIDALGRPVVPGRQPVSPALRQSGCGTQRRAQNRERSQGGEQKPPIETHGGVDRPHVDAPMCLLAANLISGSLFQKRVMFAGGGFGCLGRLALYSSTTFRTGPITQLYISPMLCSSRGSDSMLNTLG